jgi:hypothetical protein
MVVFKEATNDVTIWRIRVVCWISKDTRPPRMHTHRLPVTKSSTQTHTRTHARSHTRRLICNTYYFSTPTIIRERSSILHVHSLFCYKLIRFREIIHVCYENHKKNIHALFTQILIIHLNRRYIQ